MNLPDTLVAVGIHLWQSTLLALVVALAMRTVLQHAEPRVRYAIWFCTSLKFLVPVAALMAVGRAIGSFAPIVASMPVPVGEAIEQVRGGPAAAVLTQSLGSTPGAEPASPMPWLLALWSIGTITILVRWWMQWQAVGRRARSAVPMGEVEGVRILSIASMDDGHCEPGVFGLAQPVILMPDGIDERLTPAELESVLMHEVCHVRRRDSLTAAVHTIIEAVFWFHPLVWWIGRRLRDERERACDAAVVHRGVDADTYAHAILNTCRYSVESRLLMVPGVSGADLRQRIEGIVCGRFGSRLSPVGRALLATIAVASLVTPLVLGLLSATLRAQVANSFTGLATSATRTFDVASVKVNRSGDPGWRLGPPNQGTESITNLELRKIVASSFRIQDKMVVGGPDWIDTLRYDIQAKGTPTATSPEVWEMMRSLLAERFKLRYHIETREMPAYVLVVARGGHKLVRGEDGECAEVIRAGKSTCDAIRFMPFGIGIRDMPLAALTAGLARSLQDRPVVDRTGLTGRFDATVLWRPDGVTAEQLAEVPKDMRPPDVNMFEAFEEQAGLKLEARREPIEVLVIDHIEPADEN